MSEPIAHSEIDLYETLYCPLRRACGLCGATDEELFLLVGDTLAGVVCSTLCPACSVQSNPLRFDSWPAAVGAVREHCEHLGVDVATAVALAKAVPHGVTR